MSGSCSECHKSPSNLLRCPCGGASYCDSSCQKADWKRHKPLCQPLAMSGSCSHCHKSPASLSTCSACSSVSYCDSSCQKADWKRHKPACPPYRITEIPGKGKGMVATRNIKAGAVILEETPLLSQGGFHRVLEILRLSEELPEEQKQKVLSLHDPGEGSLLHAKIIQDLQQSGVAEEDITEESFKFTRIVMCNDISLAEIENEAGHGVNVSALYENIARINHSCAPNCVWSWKKEDIYATRVNAAKNIEKGEEIVASYITDLFLLKRERKERLENWNFECSCKICSFEGDALKKNEELRSKIMKQRENVSKFGKKGDVASTLSAAKEKLELMSQIEDEVILEIPEALLDLYEATNLWGRIANIDSIRKQKLEEQANEYKNQALKMAKQFGDHIISQCEKRMDNFSQMYT